jgi:signal transduction histidine kinase
MFADARFLIVDDEPANLLLMERMLEDAGYRHLSTTADPRQALELFRAVHPDIVLLDLMMPHLDGLAVLEKLKAEIPADTYVPILILTADVTLEARRRALEAGAQDFLTKPLELFEVLLRIRNVLDARRLYLALETQNRSLEETVKHRTERLLQSEKVATMGSLLAGVAHELNNPLTVLSGQAQLLAGQGDAVVQHRAAKIGEAADRCVRIVRNFLALARQRPPERASTQLARVIEGALELLGYELRTDNVGVVVQLAELPAIWADPHQLHQVVVNLVGNAHQAMGRQDRPRRITIRGDHEPGAGRVRLTIADTGPGIPADVRARIFEPFFTTKPQGQGTGLGLSLCRGIVEEHGGTITVDSTVGVGTTFIIDLPLGPTEAAASAAQSADAGTPVRPSQILIVDDEAGVAEIVAEAVQRDGHTTSIAVDGAMALEMLAREPFDLVVSDSRMPVLDGEDFFAEALRRFPRLRRGIVFLTGDVLSDEKREFIERTGAPFLAKPCDLDELRGTINRVLAQR